MRGCGLSSCARARRTKAQTDTPGESNRGHAIWTVMRKGRQSYANRETISVYALVVTAQAAHQGIATKHFTVDNEMSNEPNYKQGRILNIIV
jgi:hypothetical protein